MKILLISFSNDDNTMYPHLKYVLEYLRENFETDYFQFEERGYSFDYVLKLKKRGRKVIKDIIKDYFNLKNLKKNKYDKIIAIDHFAFWIATLIFGTKNTIFWSFDMIGQDLPYYKNPIVRYILKQNKKLIEKGSKVIIQTKSRLELLSKILDTEIKDDRAFFLPVSIGKIDCLPSYEIKNTPLILMQSTSFDGVRYTKELIEQYQKDDNYNLYLHGMVYEDFSYVDEKYEKIPFFSEFHLKPIYVYKAIKNCDIGFLGYNLKEENCRRLYCSCGQLAEFLRMGKPIISLGNNDVGKNLEANNAGIEIKDISEIGDAVEKIKNNYEFYSKNAYQLFLKDLDISNYLPKLGEWFNEL